MRQLDTFWKPCRADGRYAVIRPLDVGEANKLRFDLGSDPSIWQGRGKTAEGASREGYDRRDACQHNFGSVRARGGNSPPSATSKKTRSYQLWMPTLRLPANGARLDASCVSAWLPISRTPTAPSLASRARKGRSFTPGRGAGAVPYIERTGQFAAWAARGQGAYAAFPFGVICSIACGRICDSFASSSFGGIPSFAASCWMVSDPST